MGSRTGGHPEGTQADDHDGTSVQAWVERQMMGRALISGFIALVLLAMLVSNLPSSELRDETFPVVEPLLDATALTQNWNLFAPDPRNSTLRLAARMTYPDGVTLEWHQPESDPFVGPYRAYRWRKLANNMLSDRRSFLWPDMTDWLARNHRRNGELPERVVLLRQFYRPPEPGSGDMTRPPWREDVLYRSDRRTEGSR